MREKNKKAFILAFVFAVLFALFTVSLKIVDVRVAGEDGQAVGFAMVNEAFHTLTGVNMIWYNITDFFLWLSFAVCILFAVIGVVELVKRRSIDEVDKEIVCLGILYALCAGIYALFEKVIINYRPVIIDGELEASYPSTHTFLTLVIIISAAMAAGSLIHSKAVVILIRCVAALISVLAVFGRAVCGVHWFTDIVGALLLSAFLLTLYYAVTAKDKKRRETRSELHF